jgi:uncharacterized OB-fold protein
MAIVKCKACGKRVNGKAKYCSFCGEKIAGYTAERVTSMVAGIVVIAVMTFLLHSCSFS